MDTSSCRSLCKEEIIAKAAELGFDACGFAKAEPVDAVNIGYYDHWIERKLHGDLDYMEKYRDLRCNPDGLLPGAKTVISLALNYYPAELRSKDFPIFAYYAYGKDYHKVIRKKAALLTDFLYAATGCETRICIDTAPIRERYWAQKAGIGFVGKNHQLIIPGRGSFFFLTEIITTLEIEPDAPCSLSCGNCRRCIDACPAKALAPNEPLDANKCLSCLTIESRKPFSDETVKSLGKHVYGCDECQSACPHNRFASPNNSPEFAPSREFLDLNEEKLLALTEADYQRIFSGSAVKRAKYSGLMRNISAALSKKQS